MSTSCEWGRPHIKQGWPPPIKKTPSPLQMPQSPIQVALALVQVALGVVQVPLVPLQAVQFPLCKCHQSRVVNGMTASGKRLDTRCQTPRLALGNGAVLSSKTRCKRKCAQRAKRLQIGLTTAQKPSACPGSIVRGRCPSGLKTAEKTPVKLTEGGKIEKIAQYSPQTACIFPARYLNHCVCAMDRAKFQYCPLLQVQQFAPMEV